MPDVKLAEMALRLSKSDDFRVLKRLPLAKPKKRALKAGEKIAIILDTETTGLNPTKDEIIELAALAVTYDEKYKITGITNSYSQQREPSKPISDQIADLTGLTNDDLTGKEINFGKLENFVGEASIIIAHNAAFDRPFCENLSNCFREKAWACSLTEIDWRALGFDGVNLGYLLMQSGYFHAGHRALNDCYALLQLLLYNAKTIDQSVFEILIQSARSKRIVIEVGAPYEFREMLKFRGYRWKPSSRNKGGFWFTILNEDEGKREIFKLTSKFGLKQTMIESRRISAFELYKADSK